MIVCYKIMLEGVRLFFEEVWGIIEDWKDWVWEV